MKRFKYRLSAIVLLFLFKIMLDLIWSRVISVFYKGEYIFIPDYSFSKTGIMLLLLVLYIPFYLKYIEGNMLREKFMLFYTLMYYVPGLAYFQAVYVERELLCAWCLYWGILLLITFPKRLLRRTERIYLKNRFVPTIIIITIICTVLLISWKYTGFRFYLTFTNEYSLRADEANFNLPRIMSYLYSMAPLVLATAITICVQEKKVFLALIMIIIQMLNFSIGGHKTVLIITFIACALPYVDRLAKRWGNCIYTGIMVAEIVGEYIFYTFTKSIAVTANLSRRIYFVPQYLNALYYDFITTNKKYDYFAHGIGRFFGIKSPYPKSISQMISEIYFGTSGNANNGSFSEAYSNLGIAGCIVMPIVLIFILYLLELALKDCEDYLVLFVSFSCAFIWGSGNVTTGLLTNGILLVVLVIYFSKKYRLNYKFGNNNEKKKVAKNS